MRKLTYMVASTIDGFIAEEGGRDPSGSLFLIGGDYVDAIVADYPETLPGPARAALGVDVENRRFDTVLEGRGSYQIGLDAGIADAYPHLRHVVFSSTLSPDPASAVEVVAGDPVARVQELKKEDGLGIWLVGGARLARSLATEIDELVVKVNPVVAGTGVPMFDGGIGRRRFRLADNRVLDSGVVFLTYTAA